TIVDDVVEEAETMMEMPAAEEMVEEAAASADMAAAEAPMALPTMPAAGTPGASANGEGIAAVAVEEMVQLVGSKTFVMRDGVWMDTAFDADTQMPQQVGFASDAYFDLLTAVPELGQYLAIGEQVLVAYEDQVYEIVPGDGATEIVLPQVEETEETTVSTEPEQTTNPNTPAPSVTTSEPTSRTNQNLVWAIRLVIGLVVVVGVVLLAGRLVGKRQ
ncbi:MAG: hypothetical protein GY803_18190, partial [Chloroflexi bacterium]|nr:hypothetical protein [Chloroflexota bacterium]